ncbi:MAG: OmpH family outer membrane protein [Dysgonamonadaceae bacterium]|nr:OmpH family outer membrane protein [Dysgonamonadaceae bacterium]MDD3355646.1 OmpH family outer membrane protein [Dysgonamonadaceae bacterium]MDD4245916.1 OmpH family outer membrane protein [Dysgonamonadaceae bacterium]HUI32309.1 OmpH family outer membrane protein [Dysgonamonadaceae bacterium]
MLKKLIILFFVIAPLALVAQESKIAYINSQELFGAMPELGAIETQMNTKQEQVKKNATALETEYNNKMEEFKKSDDEITEAILLDRQKQIQQIEERYQAFMQNSEKEIRELQQKLLAPVQEKLQKAIQAVGEEKGYIYILDLASGSVAYHSPTAIDANPLVKAKLGIN